MISPLPDHARNLRRIVSVSGGKDSAATVLALREAGLEAHHYVFADTGWEAPETYEYLGTMERVLGITIDRVGVPGGMRARIASGARFPSRVQRWCTKELKIEPLRDYHERIAINHDVDTINVVGIRAEESDERAKLAAWEYSDEWVGYVWRPIVRFTIADVLAIHHRHGLPVNPLYKRGHNRVGCYPCINATKEEIQLVADHAPDRIDEIDALEAGGSEERARRNVETPGRYEIEQATFFQRTEVVTDERGEIVRLENGRPKRRGVPFPIRDAVAWSRTERGGREVMQLHLFAPDPHGGCFRWGLCEPPTRGDPGGES
jgi:3'-phosphoadenosine 5'-phosphosulfate sulfotransferase (PAPS reductase)/FAD synthetase